MAAITIAAVLGAIWLRSRPSSALRPLGVGDLAPPLHLRDLKTSEPLVLVGMRGKVAWIIFWSADAPSSRTIWNDLDGAWRKLRSHDRFTLVAAAVEADQPGRVQAAVAESEVELPVYLADPDTWRRYRALQAGPPSHVLIDAEGHVAALAQGANPQTIERLAAHAKRLLDELDPQGAKRFASATTP
jgi:hypothetical protein